jgi:sugar/nucleoside kinase (ribokinase family)
MSQNKENEQLFDVVGVGNAIVDVITEVEDAFIEKQNLVKGSMSLVSAERSAELYAEMPTGTEMPGGSAANTMVGVAQLGGSAAYIGKISEDYLGQVFREGMSKAEVSFSFGIDKDLPTARCLIQVTPDAQRTMNTFLGVSAYLSSEDVSQELVASSELLYCEGYLWDTDDSKEAIRKAMKISKSSNRKVALALSDTFCVERHREDWLELLKEFVDYIFCNEKEICALYMTEDLGEAIEKVSKNVDVAFITLGSRGSLVVEDSKIIEIEAVPVKGVVDSTGAGDIFASGVIFGMSQKLPFKKCAEMGSLMASEVITSLGPRIENDPKELVEHLL